MTKVWRRLNRMELIAMCGLYTAFLKGACPYENLEDWELHDLVMGLADRLARQNEEYDNRPRKQEKPEPVYYGNAL